ncbi:MAG: CBS domain-containing protein [Candidatus Doudnabacteria bacterium]|nr:CBS domain-containing protein [Candidatus Doudnabacteria bacterium]
MTKVKDIMTKNVITCSPDTSVKDAARLMFLNGLTGLPVLDQNDKLVGIVTDADLIKVEGRLHLPVTFAFLGSLVYLDNPLNGDEIEKQLEKLVATKVRDLMTDKVLSIGPDASIEDLADLFLRKKINPVPVIEKDKLMGIISRADIVKLIAGEKEFHQKEWRELAKKD